MEKVGLPLKYQWHAVYTKSRAEKKAYSEFQEKQIEAFLPLQRKLRQWSDRKKWVELPLIPGYVFVNISRREYDTVLQSGYVVGYVRFEGKAATIPNHQIDFLKLMLEQDDLEIEISHETFRPGQLVEVLAGPLIGLRGKLVEIKGREKVALELAKIGYSALVEIDKSHIRSYIGDSVG